MSDFNYLHSLIHIALVQLFRGDFDRARSLIDESLAAGERSEAEQRSAAGVTLHARVVLGWMQLVRGECAGARGAMAAVGEAARGSTIPPSGPLPRSLIADSCGSGGRLAGA